jgi:hypothetical protein
VAGDESVSGVSNFKVLAVVGVIASVVTLSVQPVLASSSSFSSFGTYEYSPGPHYGSAVGITAPSTSQTIASNNILLSRAGIQTFNTDGNDDASMQLGIYRGGSAAQLDNCAHNDSLNHEYLEYHPFNSGVNGYSCQIFASVGAGVIENFAVYALGAGPGENWEADIAGSVAAFENLGNITTAHAYMGGEIGSKASGSYQSVSNVTYTDAGEGTGWHYFLDPNKGGVTYVTVQANVTRFSGQDDSDWSMGDVPTPLNVDHPLP